MAANLQLSFHEFIVIQLNKRKIINDPVYGFIRVPYDSVYDLMEHPYFQRLRRISQLGLTHLVYPGAHHTRFHHALGAMHLILKAIDVLREKGTEISETEREAASIAILLHDIGHGPFSHTLENILVEGVTHESLSLSYLEFFNKMGIGPLEMAIDIFMGTYPKKFLNQLISSQLDMDRLDYLTRDSFYTGVSEGIVGLERIIKMLVVHQSELMVEEKGIYSIEKFIIARRLMYWQVYLHKTTIAADKLLVSAIMRAKELLQHGEKVFMTPALAFFMNRNALYRGETPENMLNQFSLLDDSDIITSIKSWMSHDDLVLNYLSNSLINRKLPHLLLSNKEINESRIKEEIEKVLKRFKLNQKEDAAYLVQTGSVKNEAYQDKTKVINILCKDGSVKDIAKASDNYSISALRDIVTKFFLITPR